MRLLFLWLTCLTVVLLSCQTKTSSTRTAKPRTVVTTDGEVDDQDSFIRMLLYANEFDLVGLVYSSSQWHYKGDGRGTEFTSEMPFTAERYGERTELRWPGTEWMQKHIGKYAEVYDNLRQHADGYPTADYLMSIIRVGNIDFEGEMAQDTEGSDFIKAILLDDNPAPVYLQIWGGSNTVARALKSIEDEYKDTPQWQDIYTKVTDKAIIYAILDQDATYKNYIEPKWPHVRVLYNSAQFWSFAYFWPRVVPKELQHYLSGKWFGENIIFNHGPLLAEYYTWGDGRQIENDPEHSHGDMAEAKKYNRKRYDFISEGDSPAYFHLVDVGLGNLENPSYGGWGGRLVQSASHPRRWEDGEQVTDFDPYTRKDDTTYPQIRWLEALQNDFAARADWCVLSPDSANHPPLVTVEQSAITAKRGESIHLNGKAEDPDGDLVNFHWWQYKEACTYDGAVEITGAQEDEATFTVPKETRAGDTIHIILAATDDGIPPLTRYQRVIVTVEETDLSPSRMSLLIPRFPAE